jgi:hypothetical protein
MFLECREFSHPQINKLDQKHEGMEIFKQIFKYIKFALKYRKLCNLSVNTCFCCFISQMIDI